MIRRDEWSDCELQVLYDLVNDGDWMDRAEIQLPRRSQNAIRTRMALLRLESGIVPKHCGPKAKSAAATEYQRAKEGSDKLLSALLEMVA
jgi:hypothetical protein